nr:putative gst-like protein yibf [Quercus suber]
MYTLISATPSPYARKIRVALAEKNLPFTLQTEVPWDSYTRTPQHNPLEKLPVLIPAKNVDEAVYESHFILEWLDVKHPETVALIPQDPGQRLLAKQIEVVADGVCDALVLAFFERMRGEGKASVPWLERQMRKVDGGLRALAAWAEQANSEFLVGGKLTVADLAVVSVLGFMACRRPDLDWPQKHPRLKQYWERLEKRKSFAETTPSPQQFTDPVV